MTPLLSVIIPVYNAEKYLRRCLDSVLTQSVRELEVICVDDGSRDSSPEILREAAASDPRVRVIFQPNRSAGAARNRGLAEASGEYVHFLDADDWLCPGIYRRAADALSGGRAEVFAFQYYLYDDITGESRRFPCYLDRKERLITLAEEPAFLLYNSVVPWNKVYRRAWLQEKALAFDEIACANDRGFYFRLLRSGARFLIGSDYGIYYRVSNQGSLTGQFRFENFECLIRAWGSAEAAFRDAPPEQRAMLTDTTVQNFLEVYEKAPPEWQADIFRQLQGCFGGMDVSVMTSLPFPWSWRKAYRAVCAASSHAEAGELRIGRWSRLAGKWMLWGVRGIAVKLLASGRCGVKPR